MENKDLIRELEKLHETLERVTGYLEMTSEANAALHMSDKVMYPPLTSAAGIASGSLASLIIRLKIEEDERTKTERCFEVQDTESAQKSGA